MLLALCFVAVLGISLASYLALASRSMQLSNRTVKQGQAGQLAELGIEEGLRVMNRNLLNATDATAALADWSSSGTVVNWTVDTANKRARATMSFPAGKFGTGITGTVKIRIDNYDAGSLDATWSTSTNYKPGSLVGYGGRWYVSNSIQSGKTPSLSSGYWVQEQSLATTTNLPNRSAWQLGMNFYVGSMVYDLGEQYRCTSANTASVSNRPNPTTNNTWWTKIPYVTFGSDLQYATESMVYWTNATWYRYTGSSWVTTGTGMPPRLNYSASTTYYPGDAVLSGTTWYRYINSAASSGFALTNTTYWAQANNSATTAAANWNWNSGQTYNVGDNVYHAGTTSWYRCRIAHTNQTPSSSSVYWVPAPILTQEWNATTQYNQYDVVSYNGTWYLSRTSLNSGNKPPTSTNNWYSANNSSQQWSATTAYSGSTTYRSYGGAWYYLRTANTGYTPNNTIYWTPTWTQGSGAATGTPVLYAEATVNFSDGSSSITQYRATLGRSPLFPNALAATTTLTLSGATTSVVSYDSVATPTPTSSDETYAAVLAAGTASAAGTSSLLPISSTSTTIKGYLAAQASNTGNTPRASYPGNALLRQPNGSVVSSLVSAPNVDLTRISGSPYIPQFDIQSVPGGYTTLGTISSATTLGTAGGQTPQVFTRAGNLTLNATGETLTIVGPVVINVQGDLRLTSVSSAQIVIAETGSLRIHVSGRLRLDASGGGINNQTLDPKKCVILSTATTGDHNFSTTQAFHGVIYMPNEDLLIDATTATMYGAISARAISVTGILDFHYDTSLRGAELGGIEEPWTVKEWRELTGTNNRATMP